MVKPLGKEKEVGSLELYVTISFLINFEPGKNYTAINFILLYSYLVG